MKMTKKLKNVLDKFHALGWDVTLQTKRLPIPTEIMERYSWLDPKIVEVIETIDKLVSPDSTTWLNTSGELHGLNDSAFVWNQWEIDSLEAAEGFSKLQKSVRSFWDRHFPFLMSVRDGYAYAAINKETMQVVTGEEPEYEEATFLAPSWMSFLSKIADGTLDDERWA